MRRLASLFILGVFFSYAAGCGLEGGSTEGLEVAVTDGSASGSFVYRDARVQFESVVTAPGVIEVTVLLPDLTLIATVDELGGIDLDGFAASGGDSQMLSEDRTVLLALKKALEERYRGDDARAPVRYLLALLEVWSEYPTTLSLTRMVYAEEGRSYTSLCGYCGYFVQATHDCWDYDRGDDRSTYYGYVSMHAAGPCSDETYFWTGSEWRCYEPDHSATVEYAYGDCFGRCGAGCGSSSRMTLDCLDHDSCVRFGHSMASFWCDDEFTTTTDDAISAPNCGSSCGL